MSADLKDLHRQLDSELKEAERDWDQIVTCVEADRGKLKKIVDFLIKRNCEFIKKGLYGCPH